LEDPGIDARIVLTWTFRKWDVGHGLDQPGSGQVQVAGTYECGNETLGFMKCREFLDKLKTG
jgi:hypothetical protein